MPIEHETRDGRLVWIRNPITGVISYVVDVRAKSFAFTLSGRNPRDFEGPPATPEALSRAAERCPFCPGNEDLATQELYRLAPEDLPGWNAPASVRESARWVVRVFRNLFPRIPAELTGERNESYIVVEDPRHFADGARSTSELIHTGALGESHFMALLQTDVHVMRHALENRAVRSLVIRKNQGRESGASQPHIHQQIIGSPELFPSVAAEARAEREMPGLFEEVVNLMARLGLTIAHRNGVVTYASPIGAFPRSYDVVIPEFRGTLVELGAEQLREFGGAIYRILHAMGPLPLDYEIHQGDGVPLHAHVNARLYPYSNVAGTLNLPNTLLESASALRRAFQNS